MEDTLKIQIDNYSGPLDALLDLAKLQKVDLTNISIKNRLSLLSKYLIIIIN